MKNVFEPQKQLKWTYRACGPEKTICLNKELMLMRPREQGWKKKKNPRKPPHKVLVFHMLSSLLIFPPEKLSVSKVSKFMSRKQMR